MTVRSSKSVRSGGGAAAIVYSIQKSIEARGGPLAFYRRMQSRNACKTCALGMGGQAGGMTNEQGHFPEFCKKSVQAMAADMQPPIEPAFFADHSIEELSKLSSRELEHLGRLAYPLVARRGDSHFTVVDWEEALGQIASTMQDTDPSRSFFYASGRSSSEAAFLLQWLARVYGTNNVNNCSYYCHQASGVGLGLTVGTGTATLKLEDLEHADFALLIGANPASNHPRLITQLVNLRNRGGQVVVINPMRETGLEHFHVPSSGRSLLWGSRVSDHYLMPRIGGDIALLKGILKVVIAEGGLDDAFIADHTNGWEAVRRDLDGVSLDALADNCGVPRDEIVRVGRLYAASSNAVLMWAMGITHHEHGTDNVAMIANLALARGMVGRPHAGLLPIRGHSNVQGVGSVGFTPALKAGFLTRMQEIYGLRPPEGKGLDSLGSVEAAHRGDVDFALSLGGNFYAANPDLTFAAEALGRIRTTVHINTKLNKGHVCVDRLRTDGTTFILPTLARDEEMQPTTQESMFNFVRLSDGGILPPPGEMRSEVSIITSIGARILPKDGPIDFERMKSHEEIRAAMAAVVPGYESVGAIDRTKHEFHIPGRIRHTPVFPFPDGRARFQPVATPVDHIEPDEFRLMTIRSEGQFNTVVYEEEDRYRNQGRRDVILINPEDMRRLNLRSGGRVTVRSASGALSDVFVAPYDIARGCAAMYYPEANVLVGRKVDARSRTPAYKNVKVRLESSTSVALPAAASEVPVGSGG